MNIFTYDSINAIVKMIYGQSVVSVLLPHSRVIVHTSQFTVLYVVKRFI